ncbi:hypothetical protein LIT25_01790 [Bacillus sp. F19]|nr:hypothetical protein LIT25_01790 [Bacillus sp. F19]
MPNPVVEQHLHRKSGRKCAKSRFGATSSPEERKKVRQIPYWNNIFTGREEESVPNPVLEQLLHRKRGRKCAKFRFGATSLPEERKKEHS